MWPREGFFQFEKERKTGHEIETPTRQASNIFAGVPRGVVTPLMRMLVSGTALARIIHERFVAKSLSRIVRPARGAVRARGVLV